ncbi:ParA family protein [Acinetobacter colistiniresistens]|uniref:ParA family protein n=1 Tax=Acinetobacter colistiniresistens TaxID=280145 RepID=UPI002FE12F4B
MKKIVITNEKGGIGKTSVAVHLAHFCYERGLRVLFVDMDKQGNSGFSLGKVSLGTKDTFSLFAEIQNFETLAKDFVLFKGNKSLKPLFDPTEEEFKLDKVEEYQRNFKSNILNANDYFDICIFDTPPTDGPFQRLPLKVSDFALSPFLLDKYSILGLKGIIDTTQEIKSANPKIQFLGLLPNMVSANSVTQKSTLNELQKQLSHLMLDKTAFIPNRSAIADASEQQVPVWKIDKTSAKDVGRKIKKINQLILEKMGV